MELLIVLTILTAAIWGAVFLPRVTPLIFGIGVIVVGSIFGAEFFNTKVGPLPVTLDRLMWGVLCGVIIVGRLKMRNGQALQLSPIDLFIVCFALVVIVSTFTHDWTRKGNLPMGRLLFFQLIPLSFFWIGRYTKFTERDLFYFGIIGALFGLYLAVTGIFEKFGMQSLVFPNYIITDQNIEFFGRARGPFINPVGNGIVQIFCISCCCLLWKKSNQATRLVLIGLIGILVAGVFCTMTRSVWLGLMLSVGITVWFTFPVASRGAMVSSVAIASILVVFVLSPYLNNFKRDEYVSADEMSQSAGLRPMLFAVAYGMAKDKPFFGHGYGQYKVVAGKYHLSNEWEMPVQTVRVYLQHNIFLAYLAEMGFVGLGLTICIFLCFLYTSFRLVANHRIKPAHRLLCLTALIVTLNMIVNGCFHDVSLIVMVGSLFFYMNGLSYSIQDEMLNETNRKKEDANRKNANVEPNFDS